MAVIFVVGDQTTLSLAVKPEIESVVDAPAQITLGPLLVAAESGITYKEITSFGERPQQSVIILIVIV